MKKLFATLSVFALCALLASGARADIAIATAGPMTGPYASFGAQMQAGAKMAVKNINAAGGVLGQKLKLFVQDDACGPDQAVAKKRAVLAARQLAAQGVVFVAGHFCSGSSITASKIYEEEGIVQISPASTNPAFTDRGGAGIFRICGRDEQQGDAAANYIVRHLKGGKIAVLHDNSVYGHGLATRTLGTMQKQGKKAAMLVSFRAGEKDYAALIKKLKKAAIDYAYIGGYHTDIALIARQMREQGMKAKIIGGDRLMTTEFWSIAGDAAEGALMTFPPDPRVNPAAAAVVKNFRDAQIEPEGYALYTYAAIQAWKQAAEKAGTVDPAKVSAALSSGAQFNTVLGKVSFNDNGDARLPGYVVYQWSKGAYSQLKQR